MDDKKIVIGLKKKDEKAFDAFYYQYKNLIFFVINDLLHDTEEAKDLLQDTLIDVYNKINMFNEGTNFKAWVLRIAKNKAYDYFRKKHPQIDEEVVLKEKSKMESDSTLFTDLKNILNDKEYQVLMLVALYDLKLVDVSTYMELSYDQVKYLYKNAKERAKMYL